MSLFDFGAVSAYRFAGSNAISANTNADSLAIDTQGYKGVALVSAVGASTLNVAEDLTVSVVFKEGDDTNIANATPLAAQYVVSNPDLVESNVAVKASVKLNKRYLFATYVPSTNATANVVTIGALGYPEEAP